MMKRLLLICFVTCVSMGLAVAQTEWSGINDALASGNASKLSAWFAPSLTVSLPKHKGTFSANQVRSMMADFFKENPPASFRMNHSGQTSQSGTFYLSTYTSREGKLFTVYVLIADSGGKQRITRITFEPKS
jgi:hypothetical protein